jgi:hypothetical protein
MPETWDNKIVEYDPAVPLDQLLAHPRNPKIHPRPQTDALKGILGDVGWLTGLIVNTTTGHVLDGHDRIKAAMEAGQQTAPVFYVAVPEAQEAYILATFDPVGTLAATDSAILTDLLREVSSADSAVQALLASLVTEPDMLPTPGAGGDEFDATPGTGETRVQPGDLWAIGPHRLLCGDSTDPEQVARLMGDERADMVFADPPYGIDIVDVKGWVGGTAAYDIPFGGVKRARGDVGGTAAHMRKTGKPYIAERKGGLGSTDGAKPFGSKPVRGSDGASHMVEVGRYEPVIGDDTTQTAIDAYTLAASLWPTAVHIWWGGNYYANALPPSSCWLVWDKENTGNFADAELAWTNRPTAVRIFRHMWNGLMKASERGERRVHPTQKPVALAVWCYEQYGQPGDIVFDPCAGSGISLIAAERTGRKARLCELSAAYCDVILRRAAAEGIGPIVRVQP